MRLTIFPLAQNIYSQLSQAMDSAYQKTVEAVEKIANLVFAQAQKLPLGSAACFPGGLAAISCESLYFGGASANSKWITFGASAAICNMLYIKGQINSRRDKAINALEKAIQDLNQDQKKPQEIKKDLESVFGKQIGDLPDEREQLAAFVTAQRQCFLDARKMYRIKPFIMIAAIGASAYFLGVYQRNPSTCKLTKHLGDFLPC